MADWEYMQQASTTYKNWVGTAYADTEGVRKPGLYEVVGLNREDWTIVGIDLHGGGDVFIYAVDKSEVGNRSGADLAAAADRDGSLPVTSFKLRSVTPQQIIDAMQQFQVHLRLPVLGDRAVKIVDRTDLPLSE